jgi:hypothetical protein
MSVAIPGGALYSFAAIGGRLAHPLIWRAGLSAVRTVWVYMSISITAGLVVVRLSAIRGPWLNDYATGMIAGFIAGLVGIVLAFGTAWSRRPSIDWLIIVFAAAPVLAWIFRSLGRRIRVRRPRT